MKERVNSLVQRAQRGDAEAFGKLVETFQDAVFGAAYAIVRSFHDAEDIAQEAFILAYQELPRLREPEKFPGWLRRITTTACSRFLRSRKVVKSISEIIRALSEDTKDLDEPIWYRGQSNISWKLIPSIYRSDIKEGIKEMHMMKRFKQDATRARARVTRTHISTTEVDRCASHTRAHSLFSSEETVNFVFHFFR